MSVLLIVGLIALQVGVFGDPIAPIFVALLLFHRGMQAVINTQSGWQSTMNKIGSVEMVDDEFEAILANQEQSGTRRLDSFREMVEMQSL